MTDERRLDREFLAAVADVIGHEDVRRMGRIRHHDGSTLAHSLAVAVASYRAARLLGLDARSTARGALLHDFFLYDWRDGVRRGHATRHARVALANARERFDLNGVEADIILTHMWPVGGPFYSYRESALVSAMDKAVAARDLAVMAAAGLMSAAAAAVSRVRSSLSL